MFQVLEREHTVGGEEEEEAEEAAPHRVRSVRGAATYDQAHPHLRRRTRKRGNPSSDKPTFLVHLDSLFRAIVKLKVRVKKDC